MSAPEDWYARYLREQEERRRQAEARIRYALPVLRFLGVERVEIKYDGMGDEGHIQDVVFSPGPAGGPPEGLRDLLEEACYGLLPGGWEINAGSHGTLSLDVRAGAHHLDHHEREEDPEDLEDMDLEEVDLEEGESYPLSRHEPEEPEDKGGKGDGGRR
jgi:hypothetical protein